MAQSPLTPFEQAWLKKTARYFGIKTPGIRVEETSVYDIAYQNGDIILGRRFLNDEPNSDRRLKKIVHESLHAAGYPHSSTMNAAGYYSKPRKDRLSEQMRDEIKAGVPRFIPQKFGLQTTATMKPVTQKDIDTSWKHDTWKADIKETITQGRSFVDVEGVTETEAIKNIKNGRFVPDTYHHTTVGKVTKLDILSLKRKPFDSGKMTAIKNPDSNRRNQWREYLEELDALSDNDRNALAKEKGHESAYQGVFSTSTKNKLKRGESWRDRLVQYADKQDADNKRFDHDDSMNNPKYYSSPDFSNKNPRYPSTQVVNNPFPKHSNTPMTPSQTYNPSDEDYQLLEEFQQRILHLERQLKGSRGNKREQLLKDIDRLEEERRQLGGRIHREEFMKDVEYNPVSQLKVVAFGFISIVALMVFKRH